MTFRVWSGRSLRRLAMVGATFDPLRGTCGEWSLPCRRVIYILVGVDPSGGSVGNSGTTIALATWDDGVTNDITLDSDLMSFSPEIISVVNTPGMGGHGTIGFDGVGTSYVQASAFLDTRDLETELCFAAFLFAISQAIPSEPPPVTTDDVVVVGWVNSSVVNLPDGANQDLIDELNTPVFCSALVGAWSIGLDLRLGNDADRDYANAFLVKRSGNAEPPLTINPSGFLASGNFRLFNRFQAKFSSLGGIVSNLVTLQSKSEIGATPDPCSTGLSFSGEAHASNGSKGLTISGTGVYHLAEGRLGLFGQNVNFTINSTTTPWIWSVIRFDATGNLIASDTAIFPTYHIYKNGILTNIIPQSHISAFVTKDQSYQRLPSQIP